MTSLPPLAAVRVFEAAARHENFSRAAEELAMTQAAVSYQMKLLEERLGAALFVRRGRGMALTEIGRRIAPQVTGAFTSLRDAFASVRAESASVLTITAPRTFSTNWLAGRLGDFHVAHPDLTVRLDMCDEIVDLQSSSFDAAIRGLPCATPGLVCHYLMAMPVAPLASPAFLAQYKLASPADLLAVPRISPEDDWWDLWFKSLPDFDASGRSDPGIRFESQVLDGHAAIAGHGVAILSPPMFKPAIDAGLLVQPFAHTARYKNGFWLVYPEHKRNASKVRALRDWLLAAVREAYGDDPALLTPPQV
ncbi:LysR substrate-binding domain-containing protein [Sphingosinicella sp. BN140058]|uniref:LysR substrate-binding domain-containing protein n=1 Tax=Sphingosinicella sp. BN140058 TaxID=1892855 RepID=UPI001011D984|nr:LysR substrate-binding domain-containing protein [Sphingosinicella sp. BN140058]QAY76476.1 LysR family transcriptional regulator [Sphingosinicella sp. BN140058]